MSDGRGLARPVAAEQRRGDRTAPGSEKLIPSTATAVGPRLTETVEVRDGDGAAQRPGSIITIWRDDPPPAFVRGAGWEARI